MPSRYSPALPGDLAECREKNGVSLTQVAEATKIGLRYLEAIERGQFHKLPGGVYTHSYIRQYARAVRYDEDELVAYYDAVAAPEEPEVEQPENAEPWSRRVLHRLHGLVAGDRPVVQRTGFNRPCRSSQS